MKVFVIDSHAIYRRGLVASLELMERVDRVDHADGVATAREHSAMPDADVVILDASIAGGHDLIASVTNTTGARVIACTSACDEGMVVSAVQAGAVGYLRKDTLTQELLQAAVHVADGGAAVVAPDLLGPMLQSRAEDLDAEAPRFPLAKLSDREQRVLALIAEGHPTREVAEQLCYSERTVKNVLHEVTTRLQLRNRAHAVGYVMRHGLI